METALILSYLMLIYVLCRAFFYKDVVQPLVLFVVPVTLGLILYSVYFQNRWPVSDAAFKAYDVGLVSFVLGVSLYHMIGRQKYNVNQLDEMEWFKQVRVVPALVYLFGVWQTISAIRYLKNMGMFGSDLRDYFVTHPDDFPFGVVYGKYFLIFGGVFFLIKSFEDRWTVTRALVVFSAFALSITVSLYTQARTDVMMSVIPLIVVVSVCRVKDAKLSVAGIYGLFVIGLSYAVKYVLDFIEKSRFETQQVEFFSAGNQMFQYIGLPITAFDQWIVQPGREATTNGWGMIEFVDKVARMIDIKVPQTSFAPLGTFNVYSYLRDPYMAWGTLGLSVVMILAGILAAIIYYRAYAFKSYALIFYAVFANSIFMSFFSWQMANMVNVYALVFVGLIWFENKVRENNVGKI